MQQAIITGSTGLIGRAVVKYLVKSGIDVLCLGRQPLNPEDASSIFDGEVCYLSIAMEEILKLPDAVSSIDWNQEKDCVFYHFAWGGREKLVDGDFGEQLINATYSANAITAAKKMGCKKFVNAGTMEESYIERHLEKKKSESYQSSQTDYGLAKIASRDLCKMTAYLEKIDYVHTRLSVPLDPELSMGSYIASSLRKIMKGDSYDKPKDNRLFDVIATTEVAKAYHLIGESGKNKADYFIGTGSPLTLARFFEDFSSLIGGTGESSSETTSTTTSDSFFSIDKLHFDTGFSPIAFLQSFQNIRNI